MKTISPEMNQKLNDYANDVAFSKVLRLMVFWRMHADECGQSFEDFLGSIFVKIYGEEGYISLCNKIEKELKKKAKTK